MVQPAPQAPPSPLRLPPTLSQWVQRSLPCPRRAAPGWTLHWAGQAAGLWASASSVPTTIARYLRLVDGAAVGHPRCPPRTRTRAQWGQEPGPPSVARLVLAELFLRMTRGRVSAFCAVWLLPARVPASVGLSIPGGLMWQKPSSLCIAGPQNFPPSRPDNPWRGRESSPGSERAGSSVFACCLV